MKTHITTSIFILITSIATMSANNPFLQPFGTPYQSVPFNDIKIEHYSEALDKGLDEERENIQKIVSNTDAPTFENTIVALENSDDILSRVTSVLFNLAEAENNDDLEALTTKYSPLLTEASNEIYQNEALFARVKAVYDKKDELNLDTEDAKLLENTYLAFIKSGALLDAENKKIFAELSTKLSSQTLAFGQNVLKDTNGYKLIIDNEADLAGLPQYVIEAAKMRAKDNGMEDKWVFDLSMPSYFSFIKFADNRSLREQIYKAYNSKGDRNNENDNKALLSEIVNNRLQMAKTMGFDDYASYKLQYTMAENEANVYKLLNQLLESYKPVAAQEYAKVEEYAQKLTGDKEFKLQAWDWSYFSEKLKEESFSLNDSILKPYFELERVKKGVFGLAGKLYGLNFEKLEDIDAYHKDVEVYKVTDKDGRYMALLYTDFFPRAGKQGGAWMTEFRGQHYEDGKDVRPLISIVMNFSQPTETEPALLTFSEVETFLHEFGHALHGMLSECRYESLSGTNVYRDFVELPSQLMENFSTEKAFLDDVAIHYKTGEPIPEDLVKSIKDSRNFNVAYACVRQLNFGFLDMAWHSIKENFAGDVEKFELSACEKTAMFEPVNSTCTSTAFNHIFSGGYAAGYYSYKWAEVLDADAFAVFKAAGGVSSEVAERFRREVLSKGGTEHPMKLYINFKGSEPSIDALLERNGIK